MGKRSVITRRQFLKLTGFAVGAGALGSGGSFARLVRAADVVFPEYSFGGETVVRGKILVAYASKCGSSAGVAKAIGEVLHEKGAAVDVRLAKKVKDISSYRAVVVGSAIRMGKWLPAAVSFVEAHREVLGHIPVAYFLVCYTMRDPTEENRQEALSYLKPLRDAVPEVRPVDAGLFAGAVDYSKLSWIFKRVLKKKGLQEGDFRDWDAIRSWAAGVAPRLLSV